MFDSMAGEAGEQASLFAVNKPYYSACNYSVRRLARPAW